MSTPTHVIVGRVRSVHGLKGELVIEAHTDDPEAVFTRGRRLQVGTVRAVTRPDPVEIQSVRPFKGGHLVKFAGIDDRNEAELWRDRYLYLEASEVAPLADGEVYLHELHGMRVELASGVPVGNVIGHFELPQGLALDVSREGGKSIIIPWDRIVTSVDRDGRVIRIDPPEGLID